MNKAPSFKAIHGRAPIAGIDFDPDGSLCEDDHDYLSGSGQYSDDPPAAPRADKEFELRVKLPSGKFLTVKWEGKDGPDAAQRYADSHIGHEVHAWRPANWRGLSIGLPRGGFNS